MTHPTHNTQAEPTQWRKKPVVVEARRFWNDESSYDLLQWINEGQHAIGREFASWENDALIVPTLEGQHIASYGDWVIRGVKGEHYPCKPDIFAATYEPASTPPAPPAADVAGLVERLRELALEVATAKATSSVLMLRGIPHQEAERDYQQAVREFDAAIEHLQAQPKQPENIQDVDAAYRHQKKLVKGPSQEAKASFAAMFVQQAAASKRDYVGDLGFELVEKSDVWLVIDGCGNEREASLEERVLWGALIESEQLARVELPPLSDAEYRRGYRDGYNRRDDEVKGALA